MNLTTNWQTELKECLGSEKMRALLANVEKEYQKFKVCPPREKIFNALNLVPPEKVSVVILGQDPYFNEGQAVGLAFSIEHTCKKFPPSLSNIIKEIRACFGECTVEDGDLTPWARQGVLLLNTCLTVRMGAPLSHNELGWDYFINAVISDLNKKDDVVFVLWGANAQKYRPLLSNSRNLVLTSSHPSPLSASRGFLGCRHFCKINDFLVSRGRTPITW